MGAFCRDCLADAAQETDACHQCGGARVLAHPELSELSIAHLDCVMRDATLACCREMTVTSAPHRAAAFAVARPMPDVPPRMTTR